MHSTAKKCVIWAVCLFVLGGLALAWTTDLYLLIADRMGANAEVGVAVLTTVLNGVRWALFPTGAALIGAAVVIQALSGGEVVCAAQAPGMDHEVDVG